MQTFLPYSDIIQTSKVLDYRRLGKQRVEAYQILNILTNKTNSNAWKKHPAVLMWRGYEEFLKLYINTCIEEWVFRGYKNNMQKYIVNSYIEPNWLGNNLFHSSHRSNLLRKDKVYYSKFNWEEKEDLPYYWPVRK
jgi:hypothetical protein